MKTPQDVEMVSVIPAPFPFLFSKGGSMKFKVCSNLFTKVNYLIPIDHIVNRITEYDIKSAGLTMCKKYELLDKETIKTLEALPKHERNVQIGLLRSKSKKLTKQIARAIEGEKALFFLYNRIQDEDILSIKNDAIFLIGVKAKDRKSGIVEFVEKNRYSSYLNIDGIEFYYKKSENVLHVKGISDEVVQDHEEGMVSFIKEVMRLMELNKKTKLKEYLKEFSQRYKERKLKTIYYKTFNSNNEYMWSEDGVYGETECDGLEIGYNYVHFILPLLQRTLFQ